MKKQRTTLKKRKPPTPAVVLRWKKVCRLVHKSSITLTPSFSMGWYKMDDFARALLLFERRAGK